jgi:tetratricopeptide (TPR) repeat protein
MTRLEQMLQFLAEDPSDPFNGFAVAMEYEKTDPEQALSFYEKLLQNHPDYPATYYQAARLYGELGKVSEAEAVFRKGIEVLQRLGRNKDLAELRSAYENFREA